MTPVASSTFSMAKRMSTSWSFLMKMAKYHFLQAVQTPKSNFSRRYQTREESFPSQRSIGSGDHIRWVRFISLFPKRKQPRVANSDQSDNLCLQVSVCQSHLRPFLAQRRNCFFNLYTERLFLFALTRQIHLFER